MNSPRVSPRRLARVSRAVERRAERRRLAPSLLRPVDLAPWRATLRAALAQCPALPPRAWVHVLTGAWDLGAHPRNAATAHMLATDPAALADTAALVSLYAPNWRVSKRARRAALAWFEPRTAGASAQGTASAPSHRDLAPHDRGAGIATDPQ